MITAVVVLVLFATILTVLGQIARPTEGYEFGDLTIDVDVDIILPLSIVQCEPVLIYDSNTGTDQTGVFLHAPDTLYVFLVLSFPPGVGYFDWICDIPAGYAFTVSGFRGSEQTYTVQPGSSSACLGDITTTRSYVYYNTSIFESFTQRTYSGSYSSYQL